MGLRFREYEEELILSRVMYEELPQNDDRVGILIVAR